MIKKRIFLMIIVFIVFAYLFTGSIRAEDSLIFLKNIPLYPGQINGLAPIDAAVNPETNLIYVVCYKSNSVSVVSGTTNTIIKDIGVEKEPKDISIDSLNNLIYVCNYGSRSITVISGATNNVVARIDLKQYSWPEGLCVNPITKRLYVGAGDSLIVINTDNNFIVTEIPLEKYGQAKIVALNSDTNRIYVADYSEGAVYVLDGGSNEVITTIKVNGAPRGIAVNSLLNKVYVSHWQGEVTVIDGETNNVLMVTPLGEKMLSTDIAINQKTDRVYVSATEMGYYYQFRIIVIDGSINSVVTSLNVGPSDSSNSIPAGLAINMDTNYIYGLNRDTDKVAVFDGNKNTVLQEICVGSTPRGVSVNSKTNHIYVTNRDTDSVSVIDGQNDIVIKTINVGINPTHIKENAKINRVYTISRTGLSVIDGITNELVATINLGGNPSNIAVNNDDNRVFVTNPSAFPDGVLFIIDGNINAEIERIELLYPAGVAVNRVTNKIYVGTMDIGTRWDLTIIDGSNYNILKVIDLPGAQRAILTVDEVLNKIYIALPGTIVTLDGNTDEIIATSSIQYNFTGIDCNSDTHLLYLTTTSDIILVIDGMTQSIVGTGTLPLGSNPLDIAINVSTNRIYTANYNTGNVSVLSIGNQQPSIIINKTAGLTTAEDGTPETFTVVLTKDPTADVTIDISSSDETAHSDAYKLN